MNKQEIRIREASFSDVEELVSLLKELFSIEKDFQFNAQIQQQGLKLMLEDINNRCILVARDGKKVIGMISIQTLISTAEGGRVGLIEDMVIASPYRRQGIGIKLLDSIENWAINKGLLRLQLLADKDNPAALEFYEKMGWKMTNLICLRKNSFTAN